jgi:hypothetical protein
VRACIFSTSGCRWLSISPRCTCIRHNSKYRSSQLLLMSIPSLRSLCGHIRYQPTRASAAVFELHVCRLSEAVRKPKGRRGPRTRAFWNLVCNTCVHWEHMPQNAGPVGGLLNHGRSSMSDLGSGVDPLAECVGEGRLERPSEHISDRSEVCGVTARLQAARAGCSLPARTHVRCDCRAVACARSPVRRPPGATARESGELTKKKSSHRIVIYVETQFTFFKLLTSMQSHPTYRVCLFEVARHGSLPTDQAAPRTSRSHRCLQYRRGQRGNSGSDCARSTT